MIKFKGDGPKGVIFGLGLSYEILERLKKNQPIVVNLEDMGEDSGQILIFAGKDEHSMKDFVLKMTDSEPIIRQSKDNEQ